MDENASERPSNRTPADKPAPIASAWTATPTPERQDGESHPPSAAGSEHPATADATPAVAVPDDAASTAPAPGDTTRRGDAITAPDDIASATTAQVGLRAGDLDRRRVATVLHDALGKGQLSIAEFDERTAAAWSARYVAELDELTVDLIPARSGLDAAHQLPSTPSQRIQPPASARVTGDGGPTASVAIFSGFERKGVWTVPEKFTAVAIMGGGVIDLRYANFGAQHVTITATAIMGGIDVIVPDDVHVHVTGVGFMGAFDDTRKFEGQVLEPERDAPTVTINGFAMMGGVAVSRKPSGPVPRIRRD